MYASSVYGVKSGKFSNADDVIVVSNVLRGSARCVEEGDAAPTHSARKGETTDSKILQPSSEETDDVVFSALH